MPVGNMLVLAKPKSALESFKNNVNKFTPVLSTTSCLLACQQQLPQCGERTREDFVDTQPGLALRMDQGEATNQIKNLKSMKISEIPLSGFPITQKTRITVAAAATLSKQKADLLVVTTRPNEESLKVDSSGNKSTNKPVIPVSIADEIDKVTGGQLGSLANRREFNGSEGKTASVRLHEGLAFEEAGLLGLGCGAPDQYTLLDGYDLKKKNSPCALNSFSASKLGKPLATMVSSIKPKSVVLHLEAAALPPSAFEALLESFLLASSTDERFKSQAKEKLTVESLTVLVDRDIELYSAAVDKAKIFAAATNLARELASAPPNYCNPETLAKAALKVADDYNLEKRVLGRKECEERGMGCYLAVNQGSSFEPQFVHLTYKPQGPAKRKIALIGKAICMDTGGYNLKTLGGIETMKMDMGGAAAVLGCATIIGAMKPSNVEVHFIIPAAENMVDATAYRPGDILVASNGTTVEVGNTDAEGRLTLADALVYVQKEIKPDAILDCATLTGAAVIALGTSVAGVYSQDNELMANILQGARKSGTPLWPMPLFSEYKKMNESKYADISNVPSSRNAGSISSALFLTEFVKETPFAHIDMAGPAYDPGTKECTGYGATLLAETLLGE